MDSKQSETQPDLRVRLDSNTPFVDFEINPQVNLVDSSQYSLRFEWYRLLNHKKVNCHVHYKKKAILQCIPCAESNLPIQDSYYCSANCYYGNRERHFHPDAKLDRASDVDQAWGDYKYDLENNSSINKDNIKVGHDGKSWVKVGSLKAYTPSRHDFGCKLQLHVQVVDCNNCVLDSYTLVTDHVMVAAAPPRYMIQLDSFPRHSTDNQLSMHSTFRVLSYNILADMYVHLNPQKYSYCPKWALKWEHRRANLLREIITYEADVICLQEVQKDHFYNFFKPALERYGYSVTYQPKRFPVYTNDGEKVDGCATFFRKNKFREVREYKLVFSEVAGLEIDKLQPSQQEKGRKRLFKDNIAIVTILEPVENTTVSKNFMSKFCVANTHIYANEDYKDIKLWQVATLISGLEKIDKIAIPIFLCGDLNSRPESAPYEFAVHGKVDRTHSEFPEDTIGIFNNTELCHSLSLVSAYSALRSIDSSDAHIIKQREMTNSRTGEPHFTNLSDNFSGTLDYIFYSADSLRVDSLLELIDLEHIKEKSKALPSPEWSSDHIALMADFFFIKKPRGNYLLPAQLWETKKIPS